jgi:AsmA protein
VPSANGLMRLSLVIAAVFAAGIGALVAATKLVPAETVRAAVIEQIQGGTGLEPVIRGGVTVSLFPTAMVTFTDVVLGDASGNDPALSAERLTAKLALLPLLVGNIQPADMSLTRPRIAVRLEPDGRSNWSNLLATLARTLKPGTPQSQREFSFSEIRMSGGTITVVEPSRAVSETLSNVELSFAWPSISRSFGASGSFAWRGQTFDASANAGDLLAALSGERSGLKVRLAGAPFKIGFEGSISQSPSLKLEGTLSADGRSLREAMRWAGRDVPAGSGLGPFSVKAKTILNAGNWALSGVNLDLDGNIAEGVLAVTTEPRVTVKGTLAADQVDLTPYVASVEILRASERDWSRSTIAVAGLNDLDIDLRLSAARIAVSTAKLGRTAIAANLSDGRLTVAIGEAQAFGGSLKGSVTLAKATNGASIKSQLQFDNVDLETCLGELFGLRRVEGKGSLTLAAEGSGESVHAIMQTLNGAAGLTARQGAITGFNVEQLLKRLEQRPLSIAGDFRRGRTPFDQFRVAMKIADGIATMEDVRLDGGTIRLAVAGSASIPMRDLDLKGTAALVNTPADANPVFELPFVVQGRWDDPIMLPDAQSLIRRSGAAAPLLDAVRDRRALDAARNAIDRLNRDGMAPASASSVPVAPPPPAAPAAATSEAKQ